MCVSRLSIFSSQFPAKVSSSSDRHYWAKGTGFGTGSTTSAWNMDAMLLRQMTEETLVVACLAILSNFLLHSESRGRRRRGGGDPSSTSPSSSSPSSSLDQTVGEEGEREEGEEGEGEGKEEGEGEGEGEEGGQRERWRHEELFELLSSACLLPTMASYLLNDSGTYSTYNVHTVPIQYLQCMHTVPIQYLQCTYSTFTVPTMYIHVHVHVCMQRCTATPLTFTFM